MPETGRTTGTTHETGAQSKRARSKARREERAAREREAARRAALRRRILVAAGVVAVVASLFAVATLLTDEPVADESAPAQVTGEPLAAYEGSPTDPAAGAEAPDVTGTDYDGNEVTIGEPGQAQAILFLAHWCPHCQREVPRVLDWAEQGGLPENVEMVAVTTSTDPSRPNYPPQAWLDREGWDEPVLVDSDNTVGAAYGMSGTPFWVFVDDEGRVVSRLSGELTSEQLTGQVAQLSGG